MKQQDYNGKPRVAIYCRLSEEDHNKKNPLADSRSIETQKNMLSDYAREQGWTVYDIYSDDDFSGADAERPEYNRLLEDAQSGRFDIVLCKHQSRFTRDIEHVEKYIHCKFPQWGIRYVSILDGADTDITGNKKSRQINGLVNQWYLEDLSENVRKAYVTRKKSGKYTGGFAPYGYIKNPDNPYQLIIDEPAAAIVRKIFQMSADGSSLNATARYLNEQGVLPPAVYKTEVQGLNFKGRENLRKHGRYQGECRWYSSSVLRILNNETYTGGLYQYKERKLSYKSRERVKLPREQWIICQKTHEPIISRETFLLAQKSRGKRSHISRDGKVHLFSGKLVCGYCGSAIHYNCRRGTNVYYRCSRQVSLQDCPGVCVSEKLLERAVLKELSKIFADNFREQDIREVIGKISLPQYAESENLKQGLTVMENSAEKIIESKAALFQEKCRGTIAASDYEQLWDYYNAKLETIQMQLDKTRQSLLKEHERAEDIRLNKARLKEKISAEVEKCTSCSHLTRDMTEIFVDFIEVKNLSKAGRKQFRIHWLF